jgi:hypothetical protein
MLKNNETLQGPTPIELAEAGLEDAHYDEAAAQAEFNRYQLEAGTETYLPLVEVALHRMDDAEQKRDRSKLRIGLAADALCLALAVSKTPAEAEDKPAPASKVAKNAGQRKPNSDLIDLYFNRPTLPIRKPSPRSVSSPLKTTTDSRSVGVSALSKPEVSTTKNMFIAGKAFTTTQRSSRPLELHPHYNPGFYQYLIGETETPPEEVTSRQIATVRQVLVDMGGDAPIIWGQRLLDYQMKRHPTALY